MTNTQTAKATKATATKAATPAAKRAKLLAAAGVRITKPGAGRVVGMPAAIRDTKSGITFATWKDESEAKRRAFDCAEFLVIDTRGIDAATAAEIAAAWNSKAKLAPESTSALAVFTKAAK